MNRRYVQLEKHSRDVVCCRDVCDDLTRQDEHHTFPLYCTTSMYRPTVNLGSCTFTLSCFACVNEGTFIVFFVC